MKKLLLLSIISLFFCQSNLHAEGTQQFFSTYTYGVNRLFIQNCLQNIYYSGNPASSTEKIYAIVAPDFDITDLNSILLIPHTGFTVTVDLPSDRSSALTSKGINFQTTKISDGSINNYTLYIHKIVKATIPYSLNFGSLKPYNTPDPDFIGWAYRELNNATTPQLVSTTSRNMFFLAFNPSLQNDSLVCNFYASNNNKQVGLSAGLEASINGTEWVSIKEFSNNLPVNSASVVDKRLSLLIPVGTQYIRFLLRTKGKEDPNILINSILVKKNTTK